MSTSNSNAGRSSRLAVEIELDHHYQSKVYTTGSKVSGNAIIRAHTDTPFQDVGISFLGQASSRLDFVNHYPTKASRVFLNLPMPVPEGNLPSPRTFEAGRTYVVPFEFVVPFQLTLHACHHTYDGIDVKDRHLMLPPSVGSWEGTDFTPDPSSIEYTIDVRVIPSGSSSENSFETSKPINILPAYAEEPPVDVTPADVRYCMAKEKTVRNNFFTTNLGSLRVSARQPRAVMLSPDGRSASGSIAQVKFDFSPKKSGINPPEIHSVTGKIIADTYWGGSVQTGLPNMGNRPLSHFPIYNKGIPLFSHRVDKKVQWSDSGAAAKRTWNHGNDSTDTFSTEEDIECSDGSRCSDCPRDQQSHRYQTTVNVPFSLPVSKKKMFLPSFYSCQLSRAYVLELTMVTGSGKRSSTTLMVPLQIGVDQKTSLDALDTDELPSFETALAESTGSRGSSEGSLAESMQRRTSLPGYDERFHRFT